MICINLYPLEKEMATDSSILAWRIPWTEEPGRLQSVGSQESDMTEQLNYYSVQFISVAQSCPTLCNPWSCNTQPPCPSPTSGVDSNSCPLSRWCHPNISFSVIPFSSCLQSFPASQSFQMSQFFTLGSQSIGVSASASNWESSRPGMLRKQC